ncbi:hypothetical protein JB92DRAFT_1511500 [Gautieria morchelliformis]|nr:hypothetical protein JB92DRAFT_1511500 [Gautieria morchelliformis]
MRSLVSYDDIASEVPAEVSPHNGGPGLPPTKRRKNNNRHAQRSGGHRQNNDEDHEQEEHKKAGRDYGIVEESRQLTHEEIWDDSALIHAWDAAVEEYEVLNGPDKKWKSEPVNKSPLWFNIPPETEAPSTPSPGPSFLVPSIPAVFTSEGDLDQDECFEPSDPDNSRPVNFDTFVPQHDPSLPDADAKVSNGATDAGHGIVPPPPAGMSSQVTPNEAFERAMGAWYWAGYWTGVYHSGVTQKVHPKSKGHDHKIEATDEAIVGDIEQEQVSSESDEETDLMPT